MSLTVNEEAFHRAVEMLQHGKIIAYPTEGVYGLGCDPLNKPAVEKILTLKKRSLAKGFILIAHTVEHLKPYIGTLTSAQWDVLLHHWPGPYTFIVPKSSQVPSWITGEFDNVAVRVTAHPIASELCRRFGAPIVSSSANQENHPPLTDNLAVYEAFGDAIDYILPGRVGPQKKPTTVIDLLTGKILRD